MIESKFRAWDKIDKELYDEGIIDLVMIDFNENGVIIAEISIYDEGTKTHSRRKVELIQRTGLTDKNGKDIYVGDIVNIKGCNPHIVKFGKYKRKQFMNGDYPK